MNEILATIKEVQEGGKNFANWYLERGYILLDIQSGSRAQRYPGGMNASGQQYYVRRNPVYVLGRPEGVEAAPFPSKDTLTGSTTPAASGDG